MDFIKTEKNELEKLKKLEELYGGLLPKAAWISLHDAAIAKGISYKTLCNKTFLQPNNGKSEWSIDSKKKFRRETVLMWLVVADSNSEEEAVNA